MVSRASSSAPPPGSTANETPRSAMRRMIAEDTDSESRPPSPSPSVLGNRPRSSSPDLLDEDGPPPARRARITAPAPMTFNADAFAKSLVQNKKVKLDNPTPLYDFAKMTTEQRTIATYGLLLELRESGSKNKQEAAKSWTMDIALKDTIRDYTMAVIMAPMIPAYQLDTSVVMKLLVAKGAYPAEWGVMTPRITVIRRQISDVASDKRYEIKTKLGESLENNECLSALCKRILNGTKLRATPAFRGRIAFLRHQYEFNPGQRGQHFWKFIDKQLKDLRDTVNNDATKLARAVTKFIKQDEQLHTDGAAEAYDLITDDAGLPPLQLAAENALAPRVPIVQTGVGDPAPST
ncbi:hypothetical protein AURDEDRAFT_124075 [Auricularia subglabra TFB-10046 SS5]|nr:hypothetical protein AURDEDRAFT_124075 [Auricularia subglabra TFB-10046 SS5]